MQSSVIGSLSSLLLLAIALCSFLFYGVAGQDKTWLLAPVYVISYAAMTFALLKRAWRMRHGDRTLDLSPQTADRKLPTATVLWLTFLLFGVAMIPNATVPYEAKLRMLFIGAVVGSYLVWGSQLTTFKDNRLLLGLLIFVVMLAALYGLVVHFKYPDRVLWAERYAIYEGRLMSTYICPNHFAHLMQMLLPFCLALLFIPQAGLYLRILSAYSFLVFLPPLFLTESRAGWLGSIAGTGLVLCLMALRRSKRLFLVLIIFVPVCAFMLLFAGWKYSETFQRRAKPVVAFLKHQSEEGVGSEARDFRPQTWMDTIDMIRERPLTGFGPGNYRYTYPEHRKRFKGKRIVTGHPHNEYLELTADFGLIGFGLFAIAWCYGLIRILIASLKAKETRHAFIGFAFLGTAAGTMVHSLFDFEMHVYPNAAVFAFLAAVAVGPLLCAGRSVKEMAVDVGQEGAGATGSAFANAGVSGMTAVSSGLLAVGDANYRPPASSSTGPSWIKKTGAWLLAAGYFGAVVFCLQIMSSSYIRVLGDRVAQSPRPAPGAMPHAQRFYEIAVKIDPQNWRGYKGMGNLMFGNRYYSLEMDEKIRFAGQERGWYEKAYEKNPKDPEICMAYGKVLIFLGKNQGTGNSAPGTGVDGGTTALSSYGKKDSAERMAQDVPPAGRSDGGTTAVSSVDIGDDVPPDSGQKPIRQQPADGRQRTEDGVSQQPTPTSISKPPASEATDNLRSKSSTSNQLQDRGLELLREACRYRPFNDGYWWNLGVELRKAGRYAEALEVFRRAAEINRTPSTLMNIEWLLARLKALNERDRTVDDLPLQAETSKINTRKALLKESTAPGLILDVSGRAADPGLMDLLDRMGEKEK